MATDKKIIVLLLILLSGLAASCVSEGEPDNTGLKAGDTLPDFTVALNDGRVVSTSSLRGKRVLIELFNTGCPDCRESLPEINSLYESFKDDPDVKIFAIARAQEAPELALYWEENGLSLPYSPQPDRTVYDLFASSGIPRIYIADAAGIIIAAFGPEDRPSLSLLTSLLAP